ncbi:MAG TPA: LLM class flavin-dependent oxidoreductase [Candidatus Bathyarchaeia archaeon]|nr:LLM class flavin-dependent oxidoreductase [Candidatus Bathyarchaeia archaeon]
MQFGYSPNSSRPIDEITRDVTQAETFGFDYAWIDDMGLSRDVYVIITACALNTKSICLGTGVTNPYSRHPAVTAAAFATLSEIAAGRLVLGIGIGSKKNLLNPLGFKRRDIAKTCKETVGVMRELLSGKNVDLDGEFFSLHNAKLGFAMRGSIPIYIAGRGTKTLTAAGEVADGAIISSLTTPEAIEYALKTITQGAGNAGRELLHFQKAVYTRIAISKDGEKAREAVRPYVPYRIWDDSYDTLRQLGYDEAVVRRIKHAYSKNDLSTASTLVTDRMLDDFAITGTHEECVEKIEKLRQCGITLLIFSPVQTTLTKVWDFKEFSKEIISRFN